MKRHPAASGFPWPWKGTAIAALMLWTQAPVEAGILPGHRPAAMAAAPLAGKLDEATPLYLTIGLPERHQDTLKDMLREIYDPHSPRYRRFLKPDQFGALFGASEADYQTVVDFAVSHHLQVTQTHHNRLLLSVRGTAADVERAFHVTLNNYQRPDGKVFYGPDREPSVDSGVPIAHITGLDNFDHFPGRGPREEKTRTEPLSPARKGGTGYGTGPNCGGGNSYLGSDLRKIYAPNVNFDGAGQTVALVEYDNYYDSDVNAYAALAGQAAPSLTRILVDQASPPAPSCENCEVAFDIEMVMAMAPKAAILVYEGGPVNAPCNGFDTPPIDVLARIANDDLAPVVSNSWYWTGYVDTNVAVLFQQYALQGQTFLNISGDLGAFAPGDPITSPFQPVYESQLMTVVGATTLNTTGTGTGGQPTPVGNYVSESTWNYSPGPSATRTPAPNAVDGGGYCGGANPLAIPTYQVPYVNGPNGASAAYRNIPDVAMIGAQLTLVCNNGVTDGCARGTSGSSPLWAGYVALANQAAASLGQPALGYLNPKLYDLASNPVTYASDFHDVNDGSTNNYWGTNPALYQAVTGFDLCTGLGSPQAKLLYDLVGLAQPPTPTPTATPNCQTLGANDTIPPALAPIPGNTALSNAYIVGSGCPATLTQAGFYAASASGGFVYFIVYKNLVSLTGNSVVSGTLFYNFYVSPGAAGWYSANPNIPVACGDSLILTVYAPSAGVSLGTTGLSACRADSYAGFPASPYANPGILTSPATGPCYESYANLCLAPTPTLTATATATGTATPSSTSTGTPTPTDSPTPTATATATSSPTPTFTGTATGTATSTPTSTGSPTASNSPTPSATATPTDSFTVTATGTPTPTGSATATNTPTATASSTPTGTFTPSATATPTNSSTSTPTPTPTASATATPTASASSTPTVTATGTWTVPGTPTATPQATGVSVGSPFPNPVSGTEGVTILVRSPGSSTLQFDLFTEGFRRIRSGQRVFQDFLILTWDLRDDEGDLAANGLYYLRAKVKGNGGETTQIRKILLLR
ncbi:MAG TPA: protease pro-enzyme activation domain-containing protein [bacterium]|nr:protease pro-enzyme activation domain-containing protein [bacterium]